MNDIEKMIQDLNKTYGGKDPIIKKASDLPPVRAFPTGLPQLDVDMGGGVLWGKQTIIAGHEGTGKSTLGMKIVSQGQKYGIPAFWIDLERAWDSERAKVFGIDPDMVHVIRSEMFAEKVFALVRDLIRTVNTWDDTRAIFVLDSLAVNTSEALNEDAATKQYGGSARINNQSLTVWNNVMKDNQIMVVINQLTDNIGSMGEPDMMPGGTRQSFIASSIVWLRNGQTLKEGTKPIGKELKWTIKKSRSSNPKAGGMAEFYFQTGFIYEESLIKAGIALGVITQSGPFYYMPDGETKFKGMSAFMEQILQDKVFMAGLEKLVYDKMNVPIWYGEPAFDVMISST